jgi:hypothetical protein
MTQMPEPRRNAPVGLAASVDPIALLLNLTRVMGMDAATREGSALLAAVFWRITSVEIGILR